MQEKKKTIQMQMLHSQKSFQGYIFRGFREPSFVVEETEALHSLVVAGINHIV